MHGQIISKQKGSCYLKTENSCARTNLMIGENDKYRENVDYSLKNNKLKIKFKLHYST